MRRISQCGPKFPGTQKVPKLLTAVAGGVLQSSQLDSSSHLQFLLLQRRFSFARPSYSEITSALKTLNAEIDMDPKQLKKAYMELVKKHHPDKPGGCAEKMKNITTAYETLKSLSANERKNYKSQYSGAGGGYQSHYQNAAGHHQRPGTYKSNPEGPSRSAYDWQRMYQEQQRARDFQYNFTRGAQANPFQNPGPFSAGLGAAKFKVMRMPLTTIIFRVVAGYLLLAGLLMLLYRRYRDWLHDDGWRSAQSLSKKEQMEDLHRMRQEIIEKLSANPRFQGFMQEKDRERQLYEYAALKAKENAVLQKSGFEPYHPSLGTLHRSPGDPEGVIYFEPKVVGTADQHRQGIGFVPPHLVSGLEPAARIPSTRAPIPLEAPLQSQGGSIPYPTEASLRSMNGNVTTSAQQPLRTENLTPSEGLREESPAVQLIKMRETAPTLSQAQAEALGVSLGPKPETDFRNRPKIIVGAVTPTAPSWPG